MRIRREQPADEATVRAVHARAFRRPEAPDGVPPEVTLIDGLRRCGEWLPHLSFVAVAKDQVIGHVVCTRARIQPGEHPVLGLGPLGVDPPHQRRGVGHALVHTVVGAAEALDEQLIGLLGSPAYYSRFGFERSTRYDIAPPDRAWGEHFQVLPLAAFSPALCGTFVYAAPFDEVS